MYPFYEYISVCAALLERVRTTTPVSDGVFNTFYVPRFVPLVCHTNRALYG